MNASPGAPAPADPGLLVHAKDDAAERLTYARRHFDLAVEAAEASGPWTSKGPTQALALELRLSGIDEPPVDPMRWRHHGSDAHLHVTRTDMSRVGGPTRTNLQLYSRTTGRPSPICVAFESLQLEGLDAPDAFLRRACDLLRETDDAMAPKDRVAVLLDTWACAVVGHLRARGAPEIAALDFPDDGTPARLVGADEARTPIEHPDMAAITRILPRARMVDGIGPDLVVSRVRRIVLDGIAPADPLAVLRATGMIAEAVERWNGGTAT